VGKGNLSLKKRREEFALFVDDLLGRVLERVLLIDFKIL
jgi:hypothetical protein